MSKKLSLNDDYTLVTKAFRVGPSNTPTNRVIINILPDGDAYDAKTMYSKSSMIDGKFYKQSDLSAKRVKENDMYSFKGEIKTLKDWGESVRRVDRQRHWELWEAKNQNLPTCVYHTYLNAYLHDELEFFTHELKDAKVLSSHEALEYLSSKDFPSDLQLTLAYQYRSKRERNSMIKKLEAEKISMPVTNLFGENQNDEYRVAIEVLESLMTPNEIKMKFKEPNVIAKAMLTHNWLIGGDQEPLLITK